jgi:hypothetical protein
MESISHEEASTVHSQVGESQTVSPLPPLLSLASSEGRLTIGQLSQLFRPEGIAITSHPDGILVLVSDPPMRAHKTLPVPRRSTEPIEFFEGGEHTFIGNSTTLHFDQGVLPASSTKLVLPNGLALTYGQVVALGGDFYGLPDAPISDDPKPPSRFLSAFNSLASKGESLAEAQNILSIMQIEIDAVNQAIRNGQQPSTAYEALGDSLNKKWNVATGGGSRVTDLYPLGRFLKLALTNWDHFGTHAITAYQAGHEAAMDCAITARKVQDSNLRYAHLALAYAMNAFADHYLTDLFSAGHLRTPRKELYLSSSASVADLDLGSYLARFMHDEDSYWGLKVQNARNRKWTAYGDKRFFDTANQVNAQIVEEAIQASVNEIYAAYTSGSKENSGQALSYVPDLTLASNWLNRVNFSPLFIYRNGKVERRTDLKNRYDYSWKEDWWGITTAGELATIEKGQNTEIPFELNARIIQFWNDNGNLGMIVYSPLPASGYGVTWTKTFGISSQAVAYFSGHMSEKSTTDLFQFSDIFGHLGLTVYSSDGTGGYQVASSQVFNNAGPNAVAWLAGDTNNDGKTDFFQVWNSNGHCALTIYSPDGTGRYQIASSQVFDNAGPNAIAWFPGRMTKEGPTNLFQLWNDSDNLALTIYSPAESGGYRITWSNHLGPGPKALAWLTVTYQGQTHILQIYDAGDTIGIFRYAPDGKGGYTLAQNTRYYTRLETVGWLTVDANGDGNPDLVQLVNHAGRLQMIFYYWPYDGSPYGVDVNEGPGAIAWLTCDVGDNQTNIVQLWNNNGQLGIIVYSPDGQGGYKVSGQKDDLGQGAGALAWLTAEIPLI